MRPNERSVTELYHGKRQECSYCCVDPPDQQIRCLCIRLTNKHTRVFYPDPPPKGLGLSRHRQELRVHRQGRRELTDYRRTFEVPNELKVKDEPIYSLYTCVVFFLEGRYSRVGLGSVRLQPMCTNQTWKINATYIVP